MATVTYEQTLVKTVEVEVTDDELAILRSEGTSKEKERVQQRVMDAASAQADDTPLEWCASSCTDEDGNELFDVG
jgi:hypothetical protein